MTRLFAFDPADYQATFAARGYAHIPQGLTPEFHELLAGQVDEFMQNQYLKGYERGDKQQALYEFPRQQEHCRELFAAVAAVCGLDPRTMVLSERHIKTYNADAVPFPPPHKDRHATEISVGFAVRVPEGSTLVLYPEDDLAANPFHSSLDLRASLMPEQQPQQTLRHARRVEIRDQPRDVVIFRGREMWHLRENPAHTRMLYLKLNTENCDPLGEDPWTEKVRRQSEQSLDLPDGELRPLIPRMGRRVDYVHRRYNRDWREVAGVVLWGQGHLTITEAEWIALQQMDGRRDVQTVLRQCAAAGQPLDIGRLRRLVERGVIDLFAPAAEDGGNPMESAESEPTAMALAE